MNPEKDGGHPTPNELLSLRDHIDDVDDRIVSLMAERIGLAVRAHQVKRSHGLHDFDSRREAAVVRRAAGSARARGLDDEIVRDIYWRLIELAKGAQERTRREVGPT